MIPKSPKDVLYLVNDDGNVLLSENHDRLWHGYIFDVGEWRFSTLAGYCVHSHNEKGESGYLAHRKTELNDILFGGKELDKDFWNKAQSVEVGIYFQEQPLVTFNYVDKITLAKAILLAKSGRDYTEIFQLLHGDDSVI